jgi:hypothetical protein
MGSGLFCGCDEKEGGWAWLWIIIVDLHDIQTSVYNHRKHIWYQLFFQWLLEPLQGPGLFFSSVIFFYTEDRNPWTSDKRIARLLPMHGTTQTQNESIHRHPYFEWDSNRRSQRPSEWRQFMPLTTRPPWSALNIYYTYIKFIGLFTLRKIIQALRSF